MIMWSIIALIMVITVMVGLTPDGFYGIAFAAGSPLPTSSSTSTCGAVIGAAGGTLQAASRTLMVFHVTP